jgi:CMP-N,N'-diacetyllegionaminic acid synthase
LVNVLAIIPARSGSKGIPNKNFMALAGRSPLNRAVFCAFEAGLSGDQIIVSTDAAVDQMPANMPRVLWRPPEHAADSSPMIDVVRHVLEHVPGEPTQKIILLQPTQPLRTAAHVTAALDALGDDWDSVVTITPIPRSHAPDFVLMYSDSSLTVGPYSWRESWADRPTRRQDVPWPYIADGTAYCFWRKTVEQHGTIYGETGCVRGLIIPPTETCPLDTEFDWLEAERRLKERAG